MTQKEVNETLVELDKSLLRVKFDIAFLKSALEQLQMCQVNMKATKVALGGLDSFVNSQHSSRIKNQVRTDQNVHKEIMKSVRG